MVGLSKIRNATFWSFASEFLAKLIVPITNIVLARILAPEAFGVIAAINMVVVLGDTFSSAGFGRYIVQHEYSTQEELYNSFNVAFIATCFLNLIIYIFIFLFRDVISNLIGNQGYGASLAVAALSLPINAVANLLEALFKRNLEYRLLFVKRILVSIVPFFTTIPLALMGYGHWALIIGNIAAGISRVVLLSIKSKWKLKKFFKLTLLRDMLSYSIWTLFEAVAMWATSYIDIIIIRNKLGAHYTGLYKSSQTLVSGILSTITGAATSVLFVSLSRSQNNNEEFNNIFFSFQKKVALFVLPMGVGIYCFSDIITKVFLGSGWMEASEFIGIWGFCTSLVCVFGSFSREVYRAKGRLKISVIAQILHLLFTVPISIYFVNWGFIPLAYARSFAFLQIILVHFIFMKFVFHISPSRMFYNIRKSCLATLIMGICAQLLKYLNSTNTTLQFIYIGICIIIYFSVLMIFKDYRNEFKLCLGRIRDNNAKASN